MAEKSYEDESANHVERLEWESTFPLWGEKDVSYALFTTVAKNAVGNQHKKEKARKAGNKKKISRESKKRNRR